MDEMKLSDSELDARLRVLSLKALPYQILALVCFVAASISVILGGILDAKIAGVLGFLGSCAVFAAVSVRGNVHLSKMKRLVSDNITRNALEEAFSDITYDPKRCISRDLLEKARYRKDWHIYRGSDYISGKYKGVDFLFSDINLESGGKNSRTVFFGQWLVVALGREIPSPVVVSERWRDEKVKSGALGDRQDISDIQTENEAFNEQFIIKTGDAQMAFYILTPHFMEYIVSADKVANGKTHLCFTGNQVHIALHTRRDFFEVVTYKDLAKCRAKIKCEVKYITDFIDELFHNEWLFKPQSSNS